MRKPETAVAFASAVGSTVAAVRRAPVRKDSVIGGRFYEVDGIELPSVTHILSCIGKPALVSWAANQERTLVIEAAADLYLDLAKISTPMPRPAYITTLQGRIGKTKAHQRELAKAGEIGTQVHHLIEWRLRQQLGQVVGPEPRCVDDAQWAFMAWEDWAKSVALKPLYLEQMVYSLTHGYAGTMDLLAEVNSQLMLIDFKTSKAIYGEAHLQNVAYQMALAEMGHVVPVGGLIVRLPKLQTDPAFEVADVPPVADLFPVFLSVKALWVWWYAQDEAFRQRRKEQSGS